MPKILLSLFFLFVIYSGNATIIKCNNSGYASKKLTFYKLSDPITQERIAAFSIQFDTNGKCSESINIKDTEYVFCDFGVYRGMLFLQANQTINIKLPPFREKSFADQKNPYFSPISFWIATDNKNQLNNQISDFTLEFNQLTDKFFNLLFFRQSKETFDSLTFLINSKFGNIQSETFSVHKTLNLKSVEIDAFREIPTEYSEVFSTIKPAFWTNPSFITLFEKTFSKQLSFDAKAIKGNKIGAAVNQGNLTFLLKYVKEKYKVEEKMAELVLLKMLHDGFYSGDFSKTAIKKMIGAKVFAQNSNKIIKEAAIRVSKKIDFLQKETVAPTVCLKALDGKQVCSDSNKDKFKYLIFADTEMVVCREHLKYLHSIQQKFQKHLELIVILRKTNQDEIKKFVTEYKIAGEILIDESNKYIDEYKIRSFPQCFLLDEDHKVEFVSAKAPLDGFEQQFASFIQKELFERQRNQPR